MKIINGVVGIVFLGGVVAGPLGGYLAYGPISYDSAASHLALSCRLGAMNWLPNTESSQLLANNCACFGEETVKRLGPAERVREAETLRSFMIKATVAQYRETPYEQIVSLPEADALRQSTIAQPEMLDWVSYACFQVS